MEVKKIFLKIIVIILIVVSCLTITTSTYAAFHESDFYLGLELYRYTDPNNSTTANYAYKRNTQYLWKITHYADASKSNPNQSRTIYCIKAGSGFGEGGMGTGSIGDKLQIRNYRYRFDLIEDYDTLLNQDEYKKYKNGILPEGQKYYSLIKLLKHCYIPSQSDANDFRKKLLADAGIPNSKLEDYEIDIVQQLAIWHFTNNEDKNYRLNTSAENGSLNINVKTKNEAIWSSFYNKWGAAGTQKDADAYKLAKYLIEVSKEAKKPRVDLSEFKIKLNSNTAITAQYDQNYISGPYSIEITDTQENTIDLARDKEEPIDIDIQGTLSGATYTLLDENKNPTNKTLTELIEKNFYLLIPKSDNTNTNININGIQFNVEATTYNNTIYYRTPKGNLAKTDKNYIDQPVVHLKREKVTASAKTTLNLSKFDMALRKYIIKINDTPVSPSRVPVLDGSKFQDEVTTYKKQHPKDAKEVKKGDTVLYEIRVYNEGDVAGYVSEITDYLPSGLAFKTGSAINIANGWNPSGDGKTIKTTQTNGTLLDAVRQGNVSSTYVQVECIVTADAGDAQIKLKNVAEITGHSDANRNPNIVDVDSQPNNLAEVEKQNYNPATSTQGKGYQDDDDYEELLLQPRVKIFDLALRKFIVKINNVDVPSRVPVLGAKDLDNGTTYRKPHTKDPIRVKTGDTVLYTIRIYNEGELSGYAKEITDHLPNGLRLKTNSEINTQNGWTNPSGDGKTIVTKQYADRLLNEVKGTTVDFFDAQIECVVVAEATSQDISLKNVAEITIHSDANGNEIVDIDSAPNSLSTIEIQRYAIPTSTQGLGYQDDDDYEELLLPGTYFDLALRKYITSVNGKDLENKVVREPSIDVTNLVNGTSTTAEYKHRKDPVGVSTGDIVIYTLRIYNEGQLDGYAKEITDHLPPELEFVNDEFNAGYGWLVSQDGRTVKTNHLSKENDLDNLIKAFDATTMTEPDYKELKIKCKVKSEVKVGHVITNIAEISEFTDANGNAIVDRDSSANNVTLPTDENLPDYKGNTANKSVLTDSNYHYKGQQDDDDFEKLIIDVFDLALRKFITGVNETPVTNRIPVFTKKIDKNGNYVYEHTKEPVEVETADIVEYTIRVYNEGTKAGYAKEIKDDIPYGIEFLPAHATNIEYRWKMLDANGKETLDPKEAKFIVTDYRSKEQEKTPGENLLRPFDIDTMQSPFYKDVKVAFKVTAPGTYGEIITNIAQISNDSDENGDDITDIDSTPNNDIMTEDDIDVEHIKLTYFDLALRKFITGVNDKEVTNRIPVFKIDENGKYVYEHTKEPVEVQNKDIVTYTIRVFNEGPKAGYAKEVKDDLPEGLEFLPDNAINTEYRWVMLDKDGNETDKLEEADSIKTDYLSKEQEVATGRNNLLKAFNKETMTEPDHRDVKIAFKVTEPNTSDRILINKAQISNDSDENGDDITDIDSTPNKWIEGEDDQDIEKVKVKYFDLALRKWVTEAIVILDGKETVTQTGHKAEDDPEEVVKVEIVESKLKKVVVKFRYKIRVTNEGEIEGYVDEISDYIPKGLKFVAADNPLWRESEEEGKVTTDQLKDTLLKPGDSAEVEILLTWINGKDNMGLKVNVAEISKDRNDSDSPDIDSTPNNRVEGEDDIDDAPVILTVKTGKGIEAGYFTLALGSITILGLGIFFIKKYVL